MSTAAQNDTDHGRALERDAEALHEALSGLVRLYQFRDRDQICCFDVSVPQCYGLEALVQEGPLTLGELASRLYLEKSTASRVVDALERKGYVTRAPHPGDRRALQLKVTPAGRRLVGYSPPMAESVRELKEFLFREMYRHYRVVRMGNKAGRILRDLFTSLVREPRQLPPRFHRTIERDGIERVVCDYIAGMTDRFALQEHRKLFDPTVRV